MAALHSCSYDSYHESKNVPGHHSQAQERPCRLVYDSEPEVEALVEGCLKARLDSYLGTRLEGHVADYQAVQWVSMAALEAVDSRGVKTCLAVVGWHKLDFSARLPHFVQFVPGDLSMSRGLQFPRLQNAPQYRRLEAE